MKEMTRWRDAAAADVAEALIIAWDAFLDAAGVDLTGWEMTAARAEVQSEPPLTNATARRRRGARPYRFNGRAEGYWGKGGRQTFAERLRSASIQAGIASVAAQPRGGLGERVVELAFRRPLEDPGHFGQQVGPAGCLAAIAQVISELARYFR